MKKFIVVMILIAIGIVIGACSTSMSVAEQTHPLKIWKQNENGNYETLKVVDEETGVNYVVVSLNYEATQSARPSIAICPRYNADGTLYATE